MGDTRNGFVDTVTKRALLNRAIAFMDSYKDFTEDIFPSIKVPSNKFQWVEFGKEAQQIRDTARALYTEAEEVDISSVFHESQTEPHSIALPVDIMEINNHIEGYDVYALKQEAAMKIIMNSKLKEVCDAAADTTNSFLSGNFIDIDGTTRKKWDTADSDPLKDILDLKQVVEDSCAETPNRLIIGKTYWRALMNNDSIRNMLSPTLMGGKLDSESAQKLFEAEKVVIPRGNYWDASLGKYEPLFDDILVWAYISDDDMSPSWGNSFIKQEPAVYQHMKNRYVTLVGADVDYSVIVRSKGSAGYINNALS